MKELNNECLIFLTGHNGMVGKSILKLLKLNGFNNILIKSRDELNLTNQKEVYSLFQKNKIEVVINAAAKVGGILANDRYPYDFIMENMLIQNNLIQASIQNDIKKFIFLGSSCIYPKMAKQPIKEEFLLSGSLEPTNQWYAIAKISGIMACIAAKKQYNLNSTCLMPTNLYGPNDNFDLKSSHVIPALIRKFHESKINNSIVELWGSGGALREFLHVDDMASASLFALENNLAYDIYNVGYGSDISIKDLAFKIKKIVGYEGHIFWDDKKPDGTPRKIMDSSRLNKLGWKPRISLDDGIEKTYEWFLKNQDNLRKDLN